MEASSAVSRALRLAFAFVVISCSSTLIAQVDRGNIVGTVSDPSGANVEGAKVDRGNIVGTVSDPSGANVEGAKVVIRNLATDQSVEVTTDSSGAYAANLLRIGTYSVTVERQGFKKAVEPNVEVGVNQVVRVNLRLQVGVAT